MEVQRLQLPDRPALESFRMLATPEFKIFTDQQQIAFFQKAKACSNADRLVELTRTTFMSYYEEKTIASSGGSYLPLTVWAKKRLQH